MPSTITQLLNIFNLPIKVKTPVPIFWSYFQFGFLSFHNYHFVSYIFKLIVILISTTISPTEMLLLAVL